MWLVLQGDREKQLGIACSPLCDRQTTLVEKSQIGFIDFIVEPSFNVLGDMMVKIVDVMQSTKGTEDGQTMTILEDVEQESSTVNNKTPNVKSLRRLIIMQ